jgi:hypothetical protein
MPAPVEWARLELVRVLRFLMIMQVIPPLVNTPMRRA